MFLSEKKNDPAEFGEMPISWVRRSGIRNVLQPGQLVAELPAGGESAKNVCCFMSGPKIPSTWNGHNA